MIKRLLLSLALLVGLLAPALAANVVAPNGCGYPLYLTGYDSAGAPICAQVDYSQLSTSGLLYSSTNSSSSVTASPALVQVLALDNATGFNVGYRIQSRSLNDPQCYFYGAISSIDTGNQTITVATDIGVGGCTDTNWAVQIVPAFVWPSATTGLGTNSFAIPVVGSIVSVTTQAGLLFQPGSHIIVAYTDDAAQYFRGIAQSYSGTTLSIFVTDVGPGATGTFTTWNVTAQDGPSTTPLLSGTSSTSVNVSALTVGGSVSLTTSFPNVSSLFTTQIAVVVYSASDPSVAFQGFAVGSVTNPMSVLVSSKTGSATKTDWIINIAVTTYGTSGQAIPNIGAENIHVTNPSGTPTGGYVNLKSNTSVNDGTASLALNASGSNSNLSLVWSGIRTLTVAGTGSITGTNTGDQTFGGITTSNLSPMTTRGDIITGGVSGAAQRLALGATNAIVSSDGTDTKFQTAATLGLVTTSTSVTCSQLPAMTGDVTHSAGSCANALVNIPSNVSAVGSILQTNIAAPASPAAGKVSIFADSIDLRFHDKNASGVIGTTVVADTGASNNFLTAISAAGAITKAQPTFSNISGTLVGSQFGPLSGDVTTSSYVATLATAQPAVHTWALAQTLTVAPVFTDQSGTRTALGLGTLATQNGTFSGTSSGTNTGDQTITLTGGVTGSGTGSFAATVVTNANLTGDITSVGNATTLAAGSASNLNSGTLAAGRMPALTGDITTSAGAVATTLATVNSNVGTFGDSTHVGTFMVNGKGLITAASSTAIAGGSGTVTTTGSPATGNLTKFSGATSIVNGDLSGDVTTTGTLATTIAAAAVTGSKIASSVALAGSPTTTTQTAGDNSTKIATTAYVDTKTYALVPSGSGSFPAATNQAVTIPAGYSDILIYFNGASSATAARSLMIQVSTDSGSTYDTIAANYPGNTITAATVSQKAVASMIEPTSNVLATTGTDGILEIKGYSQTTYKHFSADGDTTLGLAGSWTTTGVWKNTGTITTIKFLWSGTGNFDAGTYAVYVK